MTRTENLANTMRRHMTPREARLWFRFFQAAEVEAEPQAVFDDRYIVDFFVPECGLCIELDGSQHYTPQGEREDWFKQKYLEELGFRVVHYSNYEIDRQFRAVCEDILAIMAGEK